MLRLIILASAICVVFAIFACGDHGTTPKSDSHIFQIGRCQGTVGSAALSADSCFVWSFGQTLLIDFCVAANCCPDTNRFALSSQIRNDTILISVTDTAASLCSCDCGYIIRAEFDSAPEYVYQVMVYYGGSLLYSREINRYIIF